MAPIKAPGRPNSRVQSNPVDAPAEPPTAAAASPAPTAATTTPPAVSGWGRGAKQSWANKSWDFSYDPTAEVKAAAARRAHYRGELSQFPNLDELYRATEAVVRANYHHVDFGSFDIHPAGTKSGPFLGDTTYIGRDEIALSPAARFVTPQTVINVATTAAKALDNRHSQMLADIQNAQHNELAAQFDTLPPEKQEALLRAVEDRPIDVIEAPIAPKWR